jgi:prevent-host-death family protein
MNISLSEAKAQLTDLVRRAEQGEEVVLTRRGRAVARISPMRRARLSPEERGRIINELVRSTRGKIGAGPDAAHLADDLYDEHGAPI